MTDASISSLQSEINANDPKWSNPCRRMIACFAALGSDKQRAIHELWRDKGEVVVCEQDLSALPEGAREAIKAAIALCPPEQNQCHDNAWRIATSFSNMSVRSGWANGIIPMEHSWCQLNWNGALYDFDPTDIALFDGRSFTDHFCVATLSRAQAALWGGALGHSGPYCNEIASVELGWRDMSDFARPSSKRAAKSKLATAKPNSAKPCARPPLSPLKKSAP